MMLPLLILATLARPSGKHRKAGPEIFVRTSPVVSVERLAAAVHPLGFIESRVRGTRCYLIQLNNGVDEETAKQKLEKVPGVTALEPEEEPVDMNSLRSLSRKVAHLREAEREEGKPAGSDKAKNRKSEADYLAAYEYLVQSRAYPKDTFDWGSLARARKHAAQMPVTKFRQNQPGARPGAMVQSWEFSGPTNLQAAPVIDFGLGTTNGRINAVAFDPLNSNYIVAGAAAGGLWKSIDAGANWTWLSSSWSQLCVNCIAIDPVDPFTMYVGMGDYHGGRHDSYGIMKTVDGGQTWSEVFTSFIGTNEAIASILIDPTNSRTIIAGVGNPNQLTDQDGLSSIWVSNNAGQTWTMIQGTDSNPIGGAFPSIVATVPSGNNVTFYAVNAGGYGVNSNPTRILASTDHGTTWNFIPSPVQDNDYIVKAYCLATSPTNPLALYALAPQTQKLYYTQNGGSTWKDVSANLPPGNSKDYNFSQSSYDYYIACGNRITDNKNSDVLYLGLIDIQESVDLGQSWQTIGGPSWLDQAHGSITHNDQHAFAVCPTNPNLSLFTNDGGVYRLVYDPSTGKNSVTALNATLGTTMFYKLACNPRNPSFVMGGTQDNGTPLAPGDLNNWVNPGDGDGGGCAINQSNPLISYLSSEGLNIWRTDNGWQSGTTGISPSVPKTESSPFVCTMCLDPNNQYLMYLGTNYLWQYNDVTNSWTGDLGGTDLTLNGGYLRAIAIAPTDSKTIYTGSSDGALSWSIDGAKTWNGAPDDFNAINSISINPTDSTDFLFAVGGTGSSHLFRGSTANQQFSQSSVSGSGSTGLPDASVNAIVRDFDDPQNTWYVGTDVGVFQTSNAGQTWTNAGTAYGMPNVVVLDLVAVPGTRYLNAGTYGRGLWRLYLPEGDANLSTFSLSQSSVVGGFSVQGTVTLTKAAPSGGMKIQLSGDSTVGYPSSVTVPEGSTSASFTITTKATNTSFYANVTATQASIALSAQLEVLPFGVQSLTIVPNLVIGGKVIASSVTLDAPAPSSGVTITLTSNQSSVSVPKTLKITGGSTVGYFNVSTSPVSTNETATVTASGGALTATATVTVESANLIGLSVSPVLVVGGSDTTVTGTLTFNGPSTSAGINVVLSSLYPNAATVPAKITAKPTAANLTVTFPIKHNSVKTLVSDMIEVKDQYQNYYQAPLDVLPFIVVDASASPSAIYGGQTSVGTVEVNVAPSTGNGAIKVSLTANSNVISVPATVTIPAGKTSGTFTITSKAVTSTVQTGFVASYNGSQQTGSITVQAPTLTKFALSPTKIVGSPNNDVKGEVEISWAAPTGGITIFLSDSDSGAITPPSSVTILAGKTTATFNIKTKKVSANADVTVYATLGSTRLSAGVTVER